MKYYFVSYFINGRAENFHLAFDNFLIIDEAQDALDFIHDYVCDIRIINYKEISKEEFNLNISDEMYESMFEDFPDKSMTQEFNDES